MYPKDYIGKKITPLRVRINNHTFDIVHHNSEIPLSSYTIHQHNKNRIEDLYKLKYIIYHDEPNPEDSLN